MAEWIYFLHPPRDNFAETMTDEEREVWGVHFERFRRLLEEGVIVLVGPTLGPVNTGIAIFEAPDEEAARKLMEDDPVVAGGYARGELRPFRVSLLRGRDEADRGPVKPSLSLRLPAEAVGRVRPMPVAVVTGGAGFLGSHLTHYLA